MTQQHAAYTWQGNLYCGDDIVGALVQQFPWFAWVEQGGDPTHDDAETELDEIAKMFRIDRRDMWSVAEHGFPERLNDNHPGFCSVCKRWFDEE